MSSVRPNPFPAFPLAFSLARRARYLSRSTSSWTQAVGVGSKGEESRPAMRESGVGCSDNTPAEVVPQAGNFPDHSESGAALVVAEEVGDILDHQEGRALG